MPATVNKLCWCRPATSTALVKCILRYVGKLFAAEERGGVARREAKPRVLQASVAFHDALLKLLPGHGDTLQTTICGDGLSLLVFAAKQAHGVRSFIAEITAEVSPRSSFQMHVLQPTAPQSPTNAVTVASLAPSLWLQWHLWLHSTARTMTPAAKLLVVLGGVCGCRGWRHLPAQQKLQSILPLTLTGSRCSIIAHSCLVIS